MLIIPWWLHHRATKNPQLILPKYLLKIVAAVIGILITLYRIGFFIYASNFYLTNLELTWKIIKNPDCYIHFYHRGRVRTQYGDDRGAISDLTKAIELKLSNPETDGRVANTYFKRGERYESLGKKQKALADYQIAAKLYELEGETSLPYKWVKDKIYELQQNNH